MSIKIITDSGCELLEADRLKYNIEVIPLYVLEDEKNYRDGIDILPSVVYKNMRNGTKYKTSQVPYNDFIERFEPLIKKNQSFIYLAFSSGLSGTYQTAVLAERELKEKYPEAPEFRVVDTKSVCYALGNIVYGAAKIAESGASMDEIMKYVDYYVKHARHVFTVTDLQYLYRGGRLNKGTAIIGNMLNINPLLDVNEAGELRQIDKVRGEKKLLKKMIDYIEEHGDHLELQTIGISHAENLPLAEAFVKLASKRFNTDNFKMVTLGATIGTHSGPGTLAVFFFDEYKEWARF